MSGEERIYLASPTMHDMELAYIRDAFEKNWITTIGENVDAVERLSCERTGNRYAVALSNGTSALHLAIRLAGERLYGRPAYAYRGTLAGKRVFCSDMTFDASANPIAYEGGEAVFIDAEYKTWNMDPDALERAFEAYPDVRIVVLVHLYGVPAQADKIAAICKKHGALLVEDAAESLGATLNGKQTGSFGDYNVISFNGNKIITGSAGGVFLCDSEEDAATVRKWSTQSRDSAPWYQHTELGYNYRMSNIIAGIVRGQFVYLDDHIARKREIFTRYEKDLKDLPLSMNPYGAQAGPNFWLSCILIGEDGMCVQTRTESEASFESTAGKSCPTQIMEALAKENIESRPIWKPMHMQPVYGTHPFVTKDGVREHGGKAPANPCASEDIFARGLCLPSDITMTKCQQARVSEIIRACFD